ncbi:30S ribosomal protein S17e [Candidatus Woesearchaeota archaeon CG_4_10_14_0_2_um_filter_33_13]|nr:MAG: 30S ribosomal protein S17e [Candidatus Woesearchaeota archaeon CG_4_10_14_0_2_um_filter_33_13]
MGRIKTTFIKRKTRELLAKHGDKFSADFDQNKAITNQYTDVGSKKLRNVVSGYMTRLKRKEE